MECFTTEWNVCFLQRMSFFSGGLSTKKRLFPGKTIWDKYYYYHYYYYYYYYCCLNVLLRIWSVLLLNEMFVSYNECYSFQEASLQRRDYSQERLYEISIIIIIISSSSSSSSSSIVEILCYEYGLFYYWVQCLFLTKNVFLFRRPLYKEEIILMKDYMR